MPQYDWVHDCFGDEEQPGCYRCRKADPIPNFWPRDRGRIRQRAAGRLRSRHPFHRTYKVNEASAAERATCHSRRLPWATANRLGRLFAET